MWLQLTGKGFWGDSRCRVAPQDSHLLMYMVAESLANYLLMSKESRIVSEVSVQLKRFPSKVMKVAPLLIVKWFISSAYIVKGRRKKFRIKQLNKKQSELDEFGHSHHIKWQKMQKFRNHFLSLGLGKKPRMWL